MLCNPTFKPKPTEIVVNGNIYQVGAWEGFVLVTSVGKDPTGKEDKLYYLAQIYM
jgi:hypothetical protein